MVVLTSAQCAVPLSTASSASNCDSIVTGLLLWATQAEPGGNSVPAGNSSFTATKGSFN